MAKKPKPEPDQPPTTPARQWIAVSPDQTYSLISGWEVREIRGEDPPIIIAQGLDEQDARRIAALTPHLERK